MEKEESDLEKLKKNYLEIQKRYFLPDFEELNDDFNIDKVSDIETEHLIREIRKVIVDKILNYIRLIESMLNPVNVPMFVFSVVRAMKIEDRKELAEIYKKLAKIEIELIDVDISFSEEKEAKFIKKSYKIWQEVKEKIGEIIKSVRENWDNKLETDTKGYFG
jgi:hypothetical protein